MIPRPPQQQFLQSPQHTAAAPRPAQSTAKSSPQSNKTAAAFLSSEAVIDTVLLPVNTYPCLAEIEKRCGIYRTSPSLFASLVRLAEHSVVLNCMARDAVAKGVYRELCTALQAVDVTQKIPPFKDCTEKAREDFKQYLHQTTHLKTVFAFAEGGQLKKVLAYNNLLQRVMKYLGKTDSRPKKVYLLENGLDGLVQLPLPLTLLQMKFPCHVVITDRGPSSLGISVASEDKIRSKLDAKEIVEFCKRTGHKAIVNVATRNLELDRNCGVELIELGPEFLPLRTKSDAMQFYARAYESIVKLAESQWNFCFIDNSHRSLTAILVTMLLIDIGGQSVVNALNVVKSRINPPEFDGFSMAALSHLSDLSAAPNVRRTRALECLGERFAEPVEKSETKESSPSPTLLQGAHPLSLSEKWTDIENSLKKQPLPRAKIEAICSLIEGMFNRILTSPLEAKYRTIRANNPRLQSVFGTHTLGPQILMAAGWQWKNGVYTFPHEARLQLLRDILVYMASMR